MIKQLNFSQAKPFMVGGLIVFIKPLGAKLHRVFEIPRIAPPKMVELVQVLNTFALRKVETTWFFDLREKETQFTIIKTLEHMEIQPMLVSLDTDPQLSN